MENENSLPTHADSLRTVSPARGVEWLVAGFKLVFQNPGFWIVLGLLLAVATFILNFIPLIGPALGTALSVVAIGVAMNASVAMEQGRDPIPAAQEMLSNTPLLTLGAIGGGLSLVITVFVWMMFAASFGTAMVMGATTGSSTGMMTGLGMGALSMLITLGLFIALYMALWLAPGLVVFKKIDAITAMKMSLKATLKNLVAYIVLSILFCIAAFIGALPLGLGLLVVLPAALCAAYFAYRDILG